MKKIVVYGAGGHAKVILDIIQSTNDYAVACYFDDNPSASSVSGLPILSKKNDLMKFSQANEVTAAVVAIGNNFARKRISEELKQMGFILPALIHNSAMISKNAKIENGTVIMPRVVVNSSADIHEGVILNTGCIIEHDCAIGSYTHIAPGAVLCGGVKIGTMSMIGAGTTIIPMQTVGENSVVGAGSVVVRSEGPNACAYGNPARTRIS